MAHLLGIKPWDIEDLRPYELDGIEAWLREYEKRMKAAAARMPARK